MFNSAFLAGLPSPDSLPFGVSTTQAEYIGFSRHSMNSSAESSALGKTGDLHLEHDVTMSSPNLSLTFCFCGFVQRCYVHDVAGASSGEP